MFSTVSLLAIADSKCRPGKEGDAPSGAEVGIMRKGMELPMLEVGQDLGLPPVQAGVT